MDAAAYREEVYDTFSDPSCDVETKVDRALAVGCEYLDLSIGFLTRIGDGTQEIVQSVDDHELLQPGMSCPLDQAYCHRTVEREDALAVQDAATSTEIADAAVETFGLGAYIGVRVDIDEEVYGTVCFGDQANRDGGFTEAEELFVELLAKLVGRAFERRGHERERRERAERLEREKRRFEGIVETSFDIIFRLDRGAEFTFVSAAVQRILGYRPDELVGTAFPEYIADESVPDALAAYDRVLDGEAVQSLELDFEDADGEVVVLEVNGTPIEEDGEVVGVQGVGRDVTDRKERERELRLKNRAIDEADIGIAISDCDHGDAPFVYVNGEFERTTGYGAEDALGRDWEFLTGAATDPDTTATLRAGLERGAPTSVEVVHYRVDGTPFWNQVRVSPVKDDAGTVSHFLWFMADVTERKRTEQLIRLLNRVLRHNLRNEMNTLLGYGSMLADGSATDVEGVGDEVVASAELLADLSDQARELERYARQERAPERLDADALLGDVAEEYRQRFPDATVDLSVATDRGICAGTELREAVAELVENGLKHDPSAAPRVAVEAVDDGEWVELTVADDGPGIDEQESTVIARGKETALEHGSGLGLWLVNWIVTRYGGAFRIAANEDGTGSTATIRLPAIDADTPVAAVARRPTVLFR